MRLNTEDYEHARQLRDPRFDGRFFVAVRTTGIYCRPVCPVRIPRKENVVLYTSAAEASEAGFRPCLRCRPESAPGTPAWCGSSATVDQALQLIQRSPADEFSVGGLAEQLGVGPRQLSRLFRKHLGVSPQAVVHTRRLHLAKKLIDETSLSLTDICFAAGFGSVRRFNSVMRGVYSKSPSALRAGRGKASEVDKMIEVSLHYRPPCDWQAMLEFLRRRAINGVEVVTDTRYSRSIAIGRERGWLTVRFEPERHRVMLSVMFPDLRKLGLIIERVRSIFDLNACSEDIDKHLGSDALLSPAVGRFPGTRVPGCWDGFEIAVRAIIGQQISVTAATTLLGRLARSLGESGPGPGPELLFPSPQHLVDAPMKGLGITRRRVEAIRELAAMTLDGELCFDGATDTAGFAQRLCTIKGIGEWTAQYIAMRALNDPNAFPHSDLILLRAAAQSNPLSPAELIERAVPWQPWRAYAVILLWRQAAIASIP
ncbi:MAG: AlkA N-terminal domain-containing protein [Pseudohongiellaceae bacterium]